MNKKAFTLVELMGVIIVLGLISFLVTPTIINQIRNSKGKIDEVTEKLIYSATDLYLDNKQNEFPKNNGSIYCVTLQQLIDDGKLQNPVLDSNGNEISLDKIITVNVLNNSYNYKMLSTCENKVTVGNIILSSDNVIINVNSTETVTATIIPDNVNDGTLEWEIEDESIATVSNGQITGVSVGTTKVIVKTVDGSNIEKTINITVLE